MPSLSLKNWVVRKTSLNADCLSKQENELSVELGFSTGLPKDENRTCSVVSKLKVKANNSEDFFSVKLLAIFSFTNPEEQNLSDDRKNEILKTEAFPVAYELLCDYVKKFLGAANLKEITMPLFDDIKSSL